MNIKKMSKNFIIFIRDFFLILLFLFLLVYGFWETILLLNNKTIASFKKIAEISAVFITLIPIGSQIITKVHYISVFFHRKKIKKIPFNLYTKYKIFFENYNMEISDLRDKITNHLKNKNYEVIGEKIDVFTIQYELKKINMLNISFNIKIYEEYIEINFPSSQSYFKNLEKYFNNIDIIISCIKAPINIIEEIFIVNLKYNENTNPYINYILTKRDDLRINVLLDNNINMTNDVIELSSSSVKEAIELINKNII